VWGARRALWVVWLKSFQGLGYLPTCFAVLGWGDVADQAVVRVKRPGFDAHLSLCAWPCRS